ncbi:MAG: hypothetical protein H6625_08600 [Bdellovibrionaceae bacterium]|nr:hypothetical protein [Pseudobdellovibrionaceae bacterium]
MDIIDNLGRLQPMAALGSLILLCPLCFDNGGDLIQFMLGKVDVLRRVVSNKEKLNEIFKPINQWTKSLKILISQRRSCIAVRAL